MSNFLFGITSTISFVVLVSRTTATYDIQWGGTTRTTASGSSIARFTSMSQMSNISITSPFSFRSRINKVGSVHQRALAAPHACDYDGYLQGTHAHAHHVTLHDDTTSPFVMLYIQVPRIPQGHTKKNVHWFTLLPGTWQLNHLCG